MLHLALLPKRSRLVAIGGSIVVYLQLAHDSSMVFMGDRKAIFSERQQKLFELNDIAAYVGCLLEQGIAFDNLIGELVDHGLPVDAAKSTISTLLHEWADVGLVAAVNGKAEHVPLAVQNLQIAEQGSVIRYHDENLAALIRPVFAHLEHDAPAQGAVYDIHSAMGFALISRNSDPASIMMPDQAAPVLKGYLVDDVLNGMDNCLALHTACLVQSGQAMLLLGSPGSGKTTLALYMLDAGFGYVGDDIALLHPDGLVHGLRFLPAVKAGAWPLVAKIRNDLLQQPVHRRMDAKRVRYLPMDRSACDARLPIGWVICLRRENRGPVQSATMRPDEMLPHILKEAQSVSRKLSASMLKALLGALSATQCLELHYSDAKDAAAFLCQVARHGKG